MVDNKSQIKSRIKNYVDVNEKIQSNIMCVKKITFNILAHMLARLIFTVGNSVVTWDDRTNKTTSINFNEKTGQSVK